MQQKDKEESLAELYTYIDYYHRTGAKAEQWTCNEDEPDKYLGDPTRKKQRTRLDYSDDSPEWIAETARTAVPVITNGNHPTAGLVRLNATTTARLSLTHTCAFDSIFQILLVAANDHSPIKHMIRRHKQRNPMFALVIDAIASNVVQADTYQQRADILLDYLDVRAANKRTVNGSCNVVSLADYLFRASPSFGEESACRAGCAPRTKHLSSVTISETDLGRPLGRVVREHVVLPGVRCRQGGCRAMERNRLLPMGDILAIGVDSERPIDITTISTAFKCPLTGDAYRLLGIVGYNGPMDKHRRGPSNGHYTAFVQRNDVWTIYDDMQPKGGVRMARKLVVPELLFYGKRTVYRHIVLVARRSCVMLPLANHTASHVATALVLATTTIMFLIAAVVHPVSGAAPDPPFGRDEAAVRRLMATAVRHSQDQQLATGILDPGTYEFYNPQASPSSSSSLPGPSKKSAKQSGVSQWHTLNGMWGKRSGGRFGGMQPFEENDWEDNNNDIDQAPLEENRDAGAEEDEAELAAAVPVKRSWKSLNGAWGKRSADDLASAATSEEEVSRSSAGSGKQKRAWRKLNGGWGKRVSDWNGLKGMWGKRSANGAGTWNKLNGSWGKRSSSGPSSFQSFEDIRSD